MEKRGKIYDVAALGELLIDFTPAGLSPSGVALYERNPGGAPANVLVSVTRQGGKAAFIGKVGADDFGRFLEKTLLDCGVDASGLVFDQNVRTTLAFVSLDENGGRSFSFFRNPGADIMLTEQEINLDIISNAKIFHFGSLSLTDEPSRSATRFALEAAKTAGALISYDPNLRLPLWDSPETAKALITEYLPFADIVKISEDEFEFLTGQTDFERYAQEFMDRYAIKCMFVTLGAEGAFFGANGRFGRVAACGAGALDTTGCGDSFMGAALFKLAGFDGDLETLSERDLQEIVKYANACGGLTAQKKGAIPAIPTAVEVEKFMQKYQ